MFRFHQWILKFSNISLVVYYKIESPPVGCRKCVERTYLNNLLLASSPVKLHNWGPNGKTKSQGISGRQKERREEQGKTSRGKLQHRGSAEQGLQSAGGVSVWGGREVLPASPGIGPGQCSGPGDVGQPPSREGGGGESPALPGQSHHRWETISINQNISLLKLFHCSPAGERTHQVPHSRAGQRLSTCCYASSPMP